MGASPGILVLSTPMTCSLNSGTPLPSSSEEYSCCFAFFSEDEEEDEEDEEDEDEDEDEDEEGDDEEDDVGEFSQLCIAAREGGT